jgi:hypothetical protein
MTRCSCGGSGAFARSDANGVPRSDSASGSSGPVHGPHPAPPRGSIARVNLSTGRILIIVALVVAGLAVLANGFLDDGATVAAPSGSALPSGTGTTTSPPSTDTPSPTATPAPQTKGVIIIALNGTDVTGAGAAAQDLLVSDGYKEAQPSANAPVSGVKKTTVYYRDDENAAQNKADATYIADTYFDGAPVKKLDPSFSDVVPDSVTVVVVVGDDYASTLTA